MRKVVIILGTLVSAICAVSAALAQYSLNRNPALAATVFPISGSAEAALASRLAAFDLAKKLSDRQTVPTIELLRDIRLSPSVVALARNAYSREPLAIDALRVIAIDRISKRDDRQATALLEGARALSRRSTGVSILLLDRYGRQGRDREGLMVLDELLRRQSSAHGNLIVGLATNAGRDELLPDYRRLLASSPPWSDGFWRQLAQNPSGLVNAASLRVDYARDGGSVDSEIDALLVNALADIGRFGDAALVAGVMGVRPRMGNSRERIVNGDFRHVSKVPVFDWTTVSGGDYGAEIDPGTRSLVMSAISGARGEFARQLVHLPGGPMTLSVTPSAATESDALKHTTVEIECPEQRLVLLEQRLPVRATRFQANGCQWAWVRLRVLIPEGEPGIDVAIDRISLSAAR